MIDDPSTQESSSADNDVSPSRLGWDLVFDADRWCGWLDILGRDAGRGELRSSAGYLAELSIVQSDIENEECEEDAESEKNDHHQYHRINQQPSVY